MRSTLARLGAFVLLFGAFAARGQDADAEKDMAWRKDLDQILDRFSNDVDKRVDRAIAIVEKRVAAKPEDLDARLQLARLKLAKGDAEGALADCDAAAKAGGETQKRALAVKIGALRAAASAKVPPNATPEDKRKIENEYGPKMSEVAGQLTTLCGSDGAAQIYFAEEKDRFIILKDLAAGDVGKPARAIDRADSKGKKIDLKTDYKGKILVVHFWWSAGQDGMKDISTLVTLQKDFSGKGVELLGVCLDQKPGDFEKSLKENKITWRQNFEGGNWTLGQNAVAKAWEVAALPRNYVIDHEGRVRYTNQFGDRLVEAVKTLLEKKKKGK